MITPSPTTKIAPSVARGTFVEMIPASATKPALVKFAVPNTSYEMHLVPEGEITAQPGKRLLGIITVRARRIDVVQSGGRYVEPVMGRPRRVQGTVVGIDGGALVVDATMPIHLILTDGRQRPEQFEAGQVVSCDVMDGATFTVRNG